MSSTHPNLHSKSEPSGEQVFFVMAGAFWLLVAVIIGAAFLPLAAGVGIAIGLIVAVVAAVGAYLFRLLGDG